MRTVGWALGCALVIALMGCSEEKAAKVSSDSDVYCPGYEENCGVSACTTVCGNVAPSGFSSCWIYACGATIDVCDGEEPGNESLLKCAQDEGWNAACRQLGNYCNANCSANPPTRCAMVSNSNDDDACIDLLVALDESADGCTDPTPAQ
jgi:hypothetical protein